MQLLCRRKTDICAGWAAGMWRALLDFVYPPHCLLCRMPLEGARMGLCPACWAGLEVIEGHRCQRCGCPSAFDRQSCGNCAGKEFAFSRMRVLAPFNRHVQRLIHMLKYQGRTSAGRVLGTALGQALKGDDMAAGGAVIVPVPLHGSRRRERGYNQSALIGRAAGRVLGLPVEVRALRRTRATSTQTALDLAGRAANVKDAFRVRRSDLVRERTVWLIDDVVTTGATASACAGALLAAGARDVFVAAAASPYFDAGDGPAIL